MKTIAKGKEYVDYCEANCGVRIWRDSCQPIALQRGREWITCDRKRAIPVNPAEIELPAGRIDWGTLLAQNVAFYEQFRVGEPHENRTELRLVLLGKLGFDSVISRDDPLPGV